MPTWGLTPEQRELHPWGLHSSLFAPCKVTTDEIWGDIHTTVIEQAFIDTAPMQRLRRVRQLGNSHLVYPGGTHTRFSHSLGALKVVQDLLDAVTAQRNGLHAVDDLLSQWKQRDSPDEFARKLAEFTVLGRLGALLHDLGHIPFGHSIEDDLEVLVSHDKNATRFKAMWREIREQLPALIARHLPDTERQHVSDACKSLGGALGESGELFQELRPLIISKDKHAGRWRKGDRKYPFVEDLVGDTICADLLDYLLRDHQNTGLPASLGRRFTAAFFIVPEGRGPFSRRAALNIMRDGHERTDVISELLKALRYRYELNERVLYHHAKLSADAMIGKALELWADAAWLEFASEKISKLDDAEDLVESQDLVAIRDRLESASADRRRRPSAFERERRTRFEEEFLKYGDDGLLERMRRLRDERPSPELIRPFACDLYRQASGLAEALLRRELFTVVGRVGLQDAPARELHERYGSAVDRIALQNATQRFAELGREPRVLLWLPDPRMRLKLASVLVDDGLHISEFNRFEDARARRGDDIYRADQALWSLWVFVRREVAESDREAILVYLADRLGVAWEGRRGRYGGNTARWLFTWGLGQIIPDIRPDEIAKVDEQLHQVSHRGELATRADYLAHLQTIPPVRDLLARRR
jgi:HD superfamily phosphohydrolase